MKKAFIFLGLIFFSLTVSALSTEDFSCQSVNIGTNKWTSMDVNAGQVHIATSSGSDLNYCVGKYNSWDCENVEAVTNNYTSLVWGGDGNVHIVSEDTGGSDLRYCEGSYGNWTCEIADNGEPPSSAYGNYPSIIWGTDNNAHVMNWDSFGASIRYCEGDFGNWACEQVGTSFGSDTWGDIAEFDGNMYITQRDVNLLLCAGTYGNWSCIEPDDEFKYSGYSSSITVFDGNLHISHAGNNGVGGFDIRYCTGTDIAEPWICENVSDYNYQGYTQLEAQTSIVSGADNNLHISFWDGEHNDLKYCEGLMGNWTCGSIDGNAGTSAGKYSSIDVNDSLGIVHMSHYDSTTGDLRYCISDKETTSFVNLPNGGETLSFTSYTIDFNALDLDAPTSATAYIYYSETSGAFTNLIVAGYDLNSDTCTQPNLDQNATCTFEWDLSNVSDGTYFIDLNIVSHGTLSQGNFDFNASDFSDASFSVSKISATTVITSKFNYFDLNEDGTNFGEVSESWEAEEAKSKILTTQYNDVNQLLIVRKLNNNATLTVTVNGSTIGTIDANAIGDNTYYTYVFDIRDIYLNTTNLQTVLFTAGAAQDTTYLSFVGFMNKTPTDLNILAGGEAISTLFNLNDPTGYDSVYTDVNTGDWNAHTAYAVHGDLSPTYEFFGYARFIGADFDGNGFIHNRLVKDGVDYNSSDTSFEIDSTFPTILATGYDVNVVKNRNHIFWAHVRDANNHNNYGRIDIETVEYALTRTDFNLSDTNYSRTVSFAGTGSYSIRFITADQAQNKTLGSYFNVLSSEISRNVGTYTLQTSFSRNNIDLEITDAFQSIPITWVVPFSFTVTGLGRIDYYTHDYNITDSNIVDTNYGKSDGTVVIKGDTNNLTGSLVGAYTAPTTFDENAIYTVPYSLESEWENAGGANRRLFYVNYRSGSKTMTNVWLAIPLRTPFNPDTSKIQLKRCTEGINWAAKTCTTWANISIYSEGNPYNGGTYPTQDTNTNSLKDTLFMVIPSMASGGEEMFDVDVIAGYETAWALGGSIGQGGGGGGLQEEIEEFIEELVEAPLEATGELFANFVTAFFGIFSGGIESFTSLDLSGENAFYLIGLAVMILIGFWALTPSAQPVKITQRAARKGFGL